MPPAVTTAELCKGLGVSRARVDQLISRGLIAPSHTPEPGKAREWSMLDAFRLVLYVGLADTFGVSLADDDSRQLIAGVQSTRAFLYEHGITYLVISRQRVSLVQATERGAPAKPPIPAGLSQHAYARIVAEADLPAALAEAQHTPAVVINLNAVESRLLEFWPRSDA